MKRNVRPCREYAILPLCLLILVLWGCDSFSLYDLLGGSKAGGQTGAALEINPISATVTVNGVCTFTATGGSPPYRFALVSGSGTIDADTGVYTAPAVKSADVVRVIDSVGGAVDAMVNVQ